MNTNKHSDYSEQCTTLKECQGHRYEQALCVLRQTTGMLKTINDLTKLKRIKIIQTSVGMLSGTNELTLLTSIRNTDNNA